MTERLAYKVTAVAEKLDCSRATAYQLVQSGELESIKIGADRRVTDDALKAYLAKQLKTATRLKVPAPAVNDVRPAKRRRG